MIYYKKTVIAVLALSNTALFAGTMGPTCTPGNVTVPCVKTAWDFGVHALYLKPVYSNVLSINGLEINSSDTTSQSVDNIKYVDNNLAWTWAFNLEASYHFNTGNDFNLNWYHLGHKTTSKNISAVESDSTVTPATSESTDQKNSFEPSWDAVNLELGQHVDFSEHKKIRFHGGVQYARIHTDVVKNGTEIDTNTEVGFTGSTVTHATENYTYNGFGPRLGADMSFKLNRGVSVYANGATAILVGKSSAQLYSTQFTSSTSKTNIDTVTQNSTKIVPELEGKLGLNYTRPLNRGELTLDAGYVWINYFNAQVYQLIDSNFGVQGPTVGAKWIGDFI